ncbi:NAD(P)/FAD-dependent oxidoreductase [Chlamydiota bacterium]
MRIIVEKADVIIIGAGVIGLAIAAQIADNNKSIFVLEKEDRYGVGASSRNSEVIHAGIYYSPGSLKAKLCVDGRKKIYALSNAGAFSINKRGKLIFARKEEEVVELERLLLNAKENGVDNLSILSSKEVAEKEPYVKNIKAALYSPDTGVTNAHDIMDYYYSVAMENGVELVCGINIISIEKDIDGYRLLIKDTTGEDIELFTSVLINSAGLGSDKIADMIGIDVISSEYDLHYCKGDYFSVGGKAKSFLKHLMYPVPSAKSAGLGIHTTLDLAGELRLGPDHTYINRVDEDYNVSDDKKEEFYRSVKDVMPFISYEDLSPDFAGIRPKLQKENGDIRDFVIKEETNKGFPGLVNLIGIESPGLTASPAIAEYVKNIID